MALDPVANFVRGSTDAATDSTQTTISVVDASVFPNPANGEYNLVLWYDNSHPRPDQDPDVEIVRVTARDTTNDDLTVTRGQEGTAGASHPSGSALQLSPTAKVFGDVAPNDQAVENFTTNSTTSGEVPASQGDGTLSMQAVGGGGIIVEAEGPLGTPKGLSTVASLSTARPQHAAAEANGLVYAIGGEDSGGNRLASVEEYDPSTDTWSTVASLSTARFLHAAAEANGLVYAIGGRDSGGNELASVEEYDPSTDTWSTVASLSTARYRHAAAEANGLVYAIGGEDSGSNILASVEEYDPSTDTWSTVASLSTARNQHAAAEANGLVYAIGGEDSELNRLASVEEYDPSTDTWSTVASLSTARDQYAAAEANGLVYAIGGRDSGFSELASVEEYDPSTDTWSTVASLSTARDQHAAAEANGLVYAIGGRDSGFSELASVEELAFEDIREDVYSATGDTLFGIDDPNGRLLNRTTGREVTNGTQLARNGETIAAFTDKQARVYRTEET